MKDVKTGDYLMISKYDKSSNYATLIVPVIRFFSTLKLFLLLFVMVTFAQTQIAQAQSRPNACTHSSTTSTSSISGALNTSLEIYSTSGGTSATLNGSSLSRVQNSGSTGPDTTSEIVGLGPLGHTNGSQSQWRIITDDNSDISFSSAFNSNYFIGFNDIDDDAVVTLTAFDAGGAALNMSGWTAEFGNTPGGTLFSASAANVTLSGNGSLSSDPVVIVRPSPGQIVG
ncbi:MAG: hypothetical protein AAFO98_02335, partial [Pseudomonadota bacterium]